MTAASAQLDATRLGSTAFAILVADLESYGNVLSQSHRQALRQMLHSFAGYVTGQVTGRRAFPLPTGMGKTSAVVAFITALHRLRYMMPVSVAASQVGALDSLYRDLIEHGVPASLVGIKHTRPDADLVASTGDADRLFQLVTHARVRGGTDFGLFGEHRGQPRAVCFYDETLWRADTASLRVSDVLSAVDWLRHQEPPADLIAHLQGVGREIDGAVAIAALRHGGVPLDVPPPADHQVREWSAWIRQSRAAEKGLADDLLGLLELSAESLQVLVTDQGAGVISIRQAIPEGLRNVAILDASAPIRKLAHLDKSITVESFPDGEPLKSFENVEVFQYLSGGGRSTLAQNATALSREVAAIVQREIERGPEGCILIFTFMRRGIDDPPARIKAHLKSVGIDVEGLTKHGKRRLEFLTWGQHEGRNGFEHCTSVIMAGVLQRDHLSLSAAIKGQSNDPSADTPGHLVRNMLKSEIHHAIYQGASRGGCRRVTDGKAQAMTLHVIHKDQGIKEGLDLVMPGAQWSYPDPSHLPKASATGKVAAMQAAVLEFLRTIPEDVRLVSSRVVKAALKIGQDGTAKNLFTAAVRQLEGVQHGWDLQGRSLERAT